MFLTLQEWHEPALFLPDTAVAAFARSRSGDGARLEEQARCLRETYGARVRIIPLPEMGRVPSTDLRAMLPRGEGSELLCPAVYGYILRRGLYGTDADLKHLSDAELRACSYSMVKAKRVNHIRGVEEEAVRLALRWGADPEKARKAGNPPPTAPNIWIWMSSCNYVRNMVSFWTNWSGRLSNFSTPRRARPWPGRCSACRRTCVRPSTGIPPARGT